MSDVTPNLELPYIIAAQSQKHVTHNEAIRALDAIVHLSVLDRDLTAPPATPADGERYIVASGATGAWSGHDDTVAAFQDGAWMFYSPMDGWVAWCADEGRLLVHAGGEWGPATTVPEPGSLPLLGINATADATNRLSVGSESTLFSHAGASHQLKINKASTGDTGSVLYQTGYSGRAELGTVADDHFHVKVSPDGSTWHEAIIIDNDTGAVSLPQTTLGGAIAVDDGGSEVLAGAVRLNFAGAGVSVADAGSGGATITIPGAGGTSGVPAGGSTGQVLAKASTADQDTHWVSISGAGGSQSYPMHTDAILAEWHFREGSGTTAADVRGAQHIVFDATFQATYASTPVWTRRGLLLEGDMIQTPSIAGIRTVAVAYRVRRGDNAGFLVSGGPHGSGGGTMGDYAAPAYSYRIAGGQGVAPLPSRANGQGAQRLNRGGWQLLFCDFNAASTTILGFGGRHSTTTSRCTEFEIGWAACWGDVLTEPERQAVYEGVRRILADRGLYIDWRDCPTTVDCVLLWGQSNARGLAPITDLGAADQARVRQLNTLVSPGAAFGAAGYTYASPEPLVLGQNQATNQPGLYFGPEMGAAWSHEDRDSARVRPLLINKFAEGSTYLAPSTTGVAVPFTWHPGELWLDGLLAKPFLHWWDTEHRLLQQGIGPRLRALWWMLGEQDATNATYADEYEASLTALWQFVKTATGYATGLRIAVGRIRDQDPGMVAAATVRQAQADFVAAHPGEAVLIDTDGFALLGDNVHYGAAGQKALGAAFYAATFTG